MSQSLAFALTVALLGVPVGILLSMLSANLSTRRTPRSQRASGRGARPQNNRL